MVASSTLASIASFPTDRQLLELIDRLAVRAGRRFPHHIAQQLRDEAPGHILLRWRRYSPDRGSFESWCLTVIRRLGLDLCRRRTPHSSLADPHNLLGEPSALAEVIRWEELESLLRRLAEVQLLLRNACGANPVRHGIDYFAVLQLQARLALARRLTQPSPGCRGIGLVAVPDSVEELWPWDRLVRGRRCRRDWPTLHEVWVALIPAFDQAPRRVSSSQVCAAVSQLTNALVTMAPNTWVQWCTRARKFAHSRLGDRDWERHFAAWLDA